MRPILGYDISSRYADLLGYFQKRRKPIRHGTALFGTVRVRRDIYGYEVKLGCGSELLDCNPNYYGLSKEQGSALYDAILSCVPGTVDFAKKFHGEEQ